MISKLLLFGFLYPFKAGANIDSFLFMTSTISLKIIYFFEPKCQPFDWL